MSALSETHSLLKDNFAGDSVRTAILYVFIPLIILAVIVLYVNVWRMRQLVDRQGSHLLKMRWDTAKNLTGLDDME